MPSVRRRRAFPPQDAALGAFFAASSLAYVLSQAWPGAWLLAIPVVAGLMLDVEDVGERLRRRGERDAWLLVALAAVVGVGWTLYAMVSEGLLALLRGVIGSGLVLMGAFFAAGRRVWRPDRGTIPAGLAVLVIAGLDSQAPVAVPGAVAILCLLAWLALERPTLRRPGTPARPLAGLLSFAGLALALGAAVSIALPAAQPLVEHAAAELLATNGTGATGLSDSARLGDLERLALSREVVLRLWSDRPTRLRAHVLTRFDGRTWTVALETARPLTPLGAPPPALAERLAEVPGVSFSAGAGGPGLLWARVLVERLERGRLVTPRSPRIVRLAGGTPHLDGFGLLTMPFWPPPSLYGVAYAPAPGPPPDPEARAAALELPEHLDPRLRALAARLGEGDPPPRERIRRTLAWLEGCCTYSLDVGAFRTDQPVAEFLFEKRRGYCEYFASGAALLLRLQGQPTRFVNGFNVRDQDRRGDHYLVRASDAHAWIETWVDGAGWVESDPTPPAQYDALREGLAGGRLARAWEVVAAFTAELRARFAAEGGGALRWLGRRCANLGRELWRRAPTTLLPLLALAAGIWGARRLRARWRSRPTRAPLAAAAGVEPGLADLVRRLERRWASAGHPRPAHRALLEHLQAVPEAALPMSVRDAGREIVDCYYGSRYGGHRPDAARLAELQRRLEDVMPGGR